MFKIWIAYIWNLYELFMLFSDRLRETPIIVIARAGFARGICLMPVLAKKQIPRANPALGMTVLEAFRRLCSPRLQTRGFFAESERKASPLKRRATANAIFNGRGVGDTRGLN
jgi:hypothetical protein